MDRNEEREEKKEKKKTLILIIILGLVTLIAIGVMLWALLKKEPDIVLTPDYAPEDEETNRVPIGGDDTSKLDKPEGGGSVGIIYTKDGIVIDLSDEKIKMMFGNPSRSNEDMVVQVVIKDQIIVQSGRLEPGYKVTELDLLDGAADMLEPGGYEGKYVVLYYDPDSGEKAILSTEIPITITVKE